MESPSNSINSVETTSPQQSPIRITQTLELSGQSDREIIIVKQKQKVLQVNRIERIINSVGNLVPSFLRRA